MSKRIFPGKESFNTYDGTVWTWNGQITSQDPDVNVMVRKSYGEKTGVNTPNFAKVVDQDGILPLNAYNRWDVVSQRSPVRANLAHTDEYGTATLSFSSMPSWRLASASQRLTNVPNPFDGVNTDALVLAAMADILPNLDALTTALEARQTLQMVLGARTDAKQLIREALRGGKHTVKAASNAWLAWRYGWEQLGRDVANVAELLRNPIMPIVVTGQSGRSVENSTTYDELVYLDSITEHWESGSFDLEGSVRARVLAKWSARTLNAIADPAISAWETVPYSFVADWFINVGDVLAAWKVKASTDALYASLGSKFTLTHNSQREITTVNGWSGSCVSTASEVFTQKWRAPTGIPSLVPAVTVNLTSKRIIDAAALLSKRIF